MNLAVPDKEFFSDFDKDLYRDQIQKLIGYATEKFKKILLSYALFNFFFIFLITAEVLYFFIHLTLLVQTFVVAIHLALIFATIFCYFTLHMYAKTRKTEKLMALQLEFVRICKQLIKKEEASVEHHLLVSQACCAFASDLEGKEFEIFKAPPGSVFLESSLQKFSCWWFWLDIHELKELFLQASIQEHIKIVRQEPTNLEAHAALANAYVMLSGLFVDPRTLEGMDDERWIPKGKYDPAFQEKFRLIAQKAMEEFKILSDYAPLDPWVHAQLAYSYRDLQMHEEEMKEYEIILSLCPEDNETLYKLGKLYFTSGKNAKGLQIYEKLKQINYKKAESLIHFYG